MKKYKSGSDQCEKYGPGKKVNISIFAPVCTSMYLSVEWGYCHQIGLVSITSRRYILQDFHSGIVLYLHYYQIRPIFRKAEPNSRTKKSDRIRICFSDFNLDQPCLCTDNQWWKIWHIKTGGVKKVNACFSTRVTTSLVEGGEDVRYGRQLPDQILIIRAVLTD